MQAKAGSAFTTVTKRLETKRTSLSPVALEMGEAARRADEVLCSLANPLSARTKRSKYTLILSRPHVRAQTFSRQKHLSESFETLYCTVHMNQYDFSFMNMNQTSHSKQPWEGDHLERSHEACLIQQYLLAKIKEKSSRAGQRSFVLNIDACWGTGKTFFLTRFGEQLKNEGYIVGHVNAWENDYGDDPIIPVLASIQEAVTPHLSGSKKIHEYLTAIRTCGAEIALSLARNTLVAFTNRLVGDAVKEIPDILATSYQEVLEFSVREGTTEGIRSLSDRASQFVIERYLKQQTTSKQFKLKLKMLTEQLGQTDTKHCQIFVLIDELDRCRPTYAIQMLERIKHLFDTDGLVFVIATDTSQLQHSIKAVYGQGFDSQRYLLRFFDRQYRFRERGKEEVTRHLRIERLPADKLEKLSIPPSSMHGEHNFDFFFTSTVSGFNLELRELQKAFEWLCDIVTTWRYNSKIELAYMLPLICYRLNPNRNADEPDDKSRLNVMIKHIGEHMRWAVNEDDVNRQPLRASTFFNVLHDNRSIHLSDLSALSGSGFINKWAKFRFQEEFHLNHNGQWKSDQPPISVLNEYMQIIEHVGQFTSSGELSDDPVSN
jgi:hypothetical protein